MKTLLPVVVALAVLAGCSKPREAEARHATAAPGTGAAVAPAPSNDAPAPETTPPPAFAGNLHGFAADQIVSVTFKEINEQGYPMVILENLTGRDIETIRGSFRLEDSDGTYLHGTGLTIAVPGQVFIPAGGQTVSSPFGLNRKQDLMDRLATAPGALRFSFLAQDVTFIEPIPDE